ncbi:hypothetical protein Zm00014a_039549 [Zea mays]|uniref:Uncharacterized protein n=1 Tax=Zea mays TaxID=4577 RepID=A0A3L6FCL2_MAIZE|nr:hypothetical protein Zm00014a_039549 [Zea mays]
MSEDEANAAAAPAEGKNWRRKGKHDKPKPWDEDPNIDRWKIDKFDPAWNEGGMLEVSSFSTLFPQYRGKHLFLSSSCLPEVPTGGVAGREGRIEGVRDLVRAQFGT